MEEELNIKLKDYINSHYGNIAEIEDDEVIIKRNKEQIRLQITSTINTYLDNKCEYGIHLSYENKKFINHKDENPSNNDISNLELCDMKYNNTYGNRVKKASASCKKKVQCIETGIIYDSAIDVETKLNINRSHISDCCRGKRNKTGGYSWRFVNE